MRSSLLRSASRIAPAVVLLASAVAACSGDSARRPAVSSDEAPIEVQSLTAIDEARWGRGRAVWAGSSDGGATVIVTTAGIYRSTGAGSELIEIDRFGELTHVTSVALSDDGTALAVASDSPSILRRYDLAGEQPVAEYQLPVDVGLHSVAFRRADGALVADTSVGPVVWPNEALASPTRTADVPAAGRSAELRDGSTVTPVIGSNVFVRAHDGVSDQMSVTLPQQASLLDAQVSPDGSVLAFSVAVGDDVFAESGLIVLLDWSTFDVIGTVETAQALDLYAWTVGSTAVAWTNGLSLSLADHAGAVFEFAMEAESPIESVMASRSGFVTAGRNGSLLQWEPEAAEPVIIDEGDVTLEYVGIQRDGRRLTTVDFFGSVTTWNLDGDFVESADDRFAVGEATGVSVSSSGDRVAIATSSGLVGLMDGTLVPEWEFLAAATAPRVGSVVFNPVSGNLVTGLAERVGALAFDDSVTVWDTDEQESRFVVGGGGGDVVGCSFFVSRVSITSDGSLMAVASHDFDVVIFDAATGAVVHRLPGSGTILDLAFSPDDDLLVVSYDDSTVSVWNTSGFELETSYRAGVGGFFALDVLPDSATMAVVEVTGGVSLVDVMTGELVKPLDGGTLRTPAIAVSPDGSLVAAPTVDAGIAIWSSRSGDLLTVARGHAAVISDLAFAPDGTWMVSSSIDGTVHRWSLDAHGDA